MCESSLSLPEFPFGGRSDERLEMLKPVPGVVVQTLLAEHTVRTIFHERKMLIGIGEFLRELPGGLPKYVPGF